MIFTLTQKVEILIAILFLCDQTGTETVWINENISASDASAGAAGRIYVYRMN